MKLWPLFVQLKDTHSLLSGYFHFSYLLPIPALITKADWGISRGFKIIFTLEPIGSTVPKFATIDTSRSLKYDSTESIALICPAQGHPSPAFR